MAKPWAKFIELNKKRNCLFFSYSPYYWGIGIAFSNLLYENYRTIRLDFHLGPFGFGSYIAL